MNNDDTCKPKQKKKKAIYDWENGLNKINAWIRLDSRQLYVRKYIVYSQIEFEWYIESYIHIYIYEYVEAIECPISSKATTFSKPKENTHVWILNYDFDFSFSLNLVFPIWWKFSGKQKKTKKKNCLHQM